MISTFFWWLIAFSCIVGYVVLIHRYYKTKHEPSLYAGVACFIWAVTCIFGMLEGVAISVNNLPLIGLFARCAFTLSTLAYVFFNGFAISMTKPGGKMRAIWISVASFLTMTFILWAFNPVARGVLGGMPVFTFTSMYKEPYGLPLVETILALMAAIAAYPIYLFFHVAKNTKDRFIKMKSLLMGIGMLVVSIAYSIMITGAVSYQYMLICLSMLAIGSSMIFFSYLLPKQIERILFGHASMSADSVESFIERFFVSPVTPAERTQPNMFAKTLGLTHQQMLAETSCLSLIRRQITRKPYETSPLKPYPTLNQQSYSREEAALYIRL